MRSRNTPLIALFLALIIVMLLPNLRHMVQPLWVGFWHSEARILQRLDSEDAQTRSRALRAAMSVEAVDAALARKILNILQTDPSTSVRNDAGQSLGQLGQRVELPADVLQALAGLIHEAPDDAMLTAAITAIGQAAANNPVPGAVVGRIVALLDEPRAPWLQKVAITALGQIGAAQGLPANVLERLHAHYQSETRRGEREDIANALEVYAGGQQLAPETVGLLLATVAGEERNSRVRVKAIYALVLGATDSDNLRATLETAQEDDRRDVSEAARHALSVLDSRALFAGRTPAEVALDRSLPVEKRLRAIGPLKENSSDPLRRRQVVELSRDPDSRIVIAALELFKYVDGSPEETFERESFIPALLDAMAHADADVRSAAHGALAMILEYNTAYRDLPGILRTAVEEGARDTSAQVRYMALSILLRVEHDDAARRSILDRALDDTDPGVRSRVARWINTSKLSYGERRYLRKRLSQDEDTAVLAATDSAAERRGGWLYEIAQLWRSGEYGEIGMSVLTRATIAAPALVGVAFLVYFIARLLTYLYQRRWRSLTVLFVVAIWAAASYGMFLLYFLAGHANPAAGGETLLLAAMLWLAVAIYAAFGWGLHFVIRR